MYCAIGVPGSSGRINMQCSYCQYKETKVIDKRDSEGITRRRRECLKCGKRFTTYEKVELDLNVLKKDGRREKFSIEKLRKGVDKALEKRAVTSEEVDRLVGEIEAKIYRVVKGKDIESSKIGEIVMEKLKKVDKVAYIRFASVYREFTDLDDFKRELRALK
jgi:transcriptional repressor NrdR